MPADGTVIAVRKLSAAYYACSPALHTTYLLPVIAVRPVTAVRRLCACILHLLPCIPHYIPAAGPVTAVRRLCAAYRTCSPALHTTYLLPQRVKRCAWSLALTAAARAALAPLHAPKKENTCSRSVWSAWSLARSCCSSCASSAACAPPRCAFTYSSRKLLVHALVWA
jgi:hypothetical protein